MLRPERRASEPSPSPVCEADVHVVGFTPVPRPWCRKLISPLARKARGLSADSHRAAYRPVSSSRGT
eukprot:3028490-Rhodomonas_salina.2